MIKVLYGILIDEWKLVLPIWTTTKQSVNSRLIILLFIVLM